VTRGVGVRGTPTPRQIGKIVFRQKWDSILGKSDPHKKPVWTLLQGFSHFNNVGRTDTVSPSGITSHPDVSDEPMEEFPGEKVFTHGDGVMCPISPKRDRRGPGIFLQNGFYDTPVLKPFRLLLEILLFSGKRKPSVHLPYEAWVVDIMDRSHEIADIRLPGNIMDIPWHLERDFVFSFSQLDDGSTELLSKKKVVLQEQQVGIDVEKSESDNTSI
jgi:hypothetical protein